MSNVKLTTYGGLQCLCNITWGLPKKRVVPKINGSAWLEYTWDNRKAIIPSHPKHVDTPPLLALLCANGKAEQLEGSVLVVFEDVEGSIWLCATLDKGKPALEAERLFASKQDLLDYINELPKGSHKHILHSDTLSKNIKSTIPLTKLSNDTLDPRQLKGFELHTPFFAKGVNKIRLGAGVGATAIIVAVLSIQHYNKSAETLHITPQYSYVEKLDVFARGCNDAFSKIWPHVLGWSLVEEGCATQRMDDPQLRTALISHDAAAYKVFTLNSKHNEVLSTRAALFIYEDWPHQTQISADNLLVYIPFKVGRIPYQNVSITPEMTLLHAVEDAFFGIADNVSETHINQLPTVTITTTASVSEVMRRIGSQNNLSVKSFVHKNGQITLVLRNLDIIQSPTPYTEQDTVING